MQGTIELFGECLKACHHHSKPITHTVGVDGKPAHGGSPARSNREVTKTASLSVANPPARC